MTDIEYSFKISTELKEPANQNKKELQLTNKHKKKLKTINSFLLTIYYATMKALGDEELLKSLSHNCRVSVDLVEEIMFEAWEADYLSDSFISDFTHGIIPSSDPEVGLKTLE